MTAAGREVHLDNLKILLITLIIVIHAFLGYAGLVEVWTYSPLREVTLSPVTEYALFVVVAPFGFFLIGLLFLVAGLFTGPSLDRKGVRRFVVDRLLRLGVTYVVYVLLIQPTASYLLEHALGDAPGGYWQEYLAESGSHRLDSGPLWFVGVLLLFSLGYAGLVAVARRRRPADRLAGPPTRITTPRLAALALAVGGASFAVRLSAPYGSEAGLLDLNPWEWPGCLAAFALGVTAGRQGWIAAVPDPLRRNARAVTLATALAMGLLLHAASARDAVGQLMGGPNWFALGFSLGECLVVVFGPVWLLAVAQRWLRQPLPLGDVLARTAFGAFIMQTPVLLALAMALRPFALPAEVKALTVAVLGVVGSYGLAWLLLEVPGVRRVL